MQNHFKLLHFTLKKELGEVYASILIRNLALSLVSIFVPIYLLTQTNIGFGGLIIYYFIQAIFLFLFYFISASLCYKYGTNKTILSSIPFYLIFFFILYNYYDSIYLMYLSAIVVGVAQGLFWFAFNYEFAEVSDKKHRGEEVKFWYFFSSIIGTIGPLLGGLLLSTEGFNTIFFISSVLFLLSAAPLFRSKTRKLKNKIKWTNCFKIKYFSVAPKYFAQGFRIEINSIFWPLFIFLILGEYFKTGFIFSGVALVSSIVIWFVGNKIDKIDKKVFSGLSTVFDGVISITRAFVSNFAHIIGVSAASGVSSGISEISTTALAYDSENKRKIGEHILFREMILTSARFTLFAILFFSGLDIMSNLKLAFFLLAGVSILQELF